MLILLPIVTPLPERDNGRAGQAAQNTGYGRSQQTAGLDGTIAKPGAPM